MELLSVHGSATGIPVIVNIHDVELARRYATRIVGMSGGHVVRSTEASLGSNDAAPGQPPLRHVRARQGGPGVAGDLHHLRRRAAGFQLGTL
ncbi:hypothetical protein G6F31_020844 [Rhizopus arrhizus]|nr:hypothetical protein G6F31_020844 [Rhizopus arrhizus]